MLDTYPQPLQKPLQRVWFHDFSNANINIPDHGNNLLAVDGNLTRRSPTYASHQTGNAATTHTIVGGKLTSECTSRAELRTILYPRLVLDGAGDYIRVSLRTEIVGEYAGAFAQLGGGSTTVLTFGEWNAAGGAFFTANQNLPVGLASVYRCDLRIGVNALRSRYVYATYYNAAGAILGSNYYSTDIGVDAPKFHSCLIEIGFTTAVKTDNIDVDTLELWI